MSFNVQCVLSGLCSYVPNHSNDKMAVVMVDAGKHGTARDGQELAPHFPLLIVESRFVPGSDLPPGTEVVWRLDRLALRFEVEGGMPERLNILSNSTDDFRLVPAMHEAAPDFTEIDPDCFDDRRSRGLVATRLILDRGRLGAHDFQPDRIPGFRFEGKLGNTSQEVRKMANRAALHLDGVNRFQVMWRSMDGRETEKPFMLVAPANETLRFHIGNFCDGCLPRRIDDLPQVKEFEDVDFRWYYELCRDRGRISIRREESLPIPAISDGGGGPGAIQCMGGRFAAASF